jgi:hypothetical protein
LSQQSEIDFLRALLTELLSRLQADPNIRVDLADLIRRLVSSEGKP